jgi:sugar lactone lactonase YvrE
VALAAKATLGEGALWDAANNRLLWVDILEKRVGLFDPEKSSSRILQLDSFVGTVVTSAKGDLMVAIREGFARLDPSSGRISDLLSPEGHDPATTRFNDGKCDPAGRFWAGTMSISESPGGGALYSLESGGKIRKWLENISISNGIVWSPDCRHMYYIDTPTRVVADFEYDPGTGSIRNRRVAVEVPKEMGYPDGMTIDAEGMLWVALWDGSAVGRWDPRSGRLLGKVAISASHATSCAFGGPGLETLYITSARTGLSAAEIEREPLAGDIFAVQMDVPGTPAFVYGG